LKEFSYSYYESILREMKKISNIYNFKSVTSNVKSGYILRHDVDFDIEKAYKMCNLEQEIGVTSTYFILVTSDFYNILSYKNKNIIKSMSSNGFEIGLHFDPAIYGDMNLNDMQKQAEIECSIIENIVGTKVDSISLHNPSIHNQYPMFEGYKNSYSKEFFNTDLYLSDSCKHFRGKNIFEFIKKGESNLLQVLFHPIHFSKKEESYIESFNKIIEKKINYFDKYIRVNRTYKNEIEDNTLINCFSNYVKSSSEIK
jgi:hypothetical protein